MPLYYNKSGATHHSHLSTPPTIKNVVRFVQISIFDTPLVFFLYPFLNCRFVSEEARRFNAITIFASLLIVIKYIRFCYHYVFATMYLRIKIIYCIPDIFLFSIFLFVFPCSLLNLPAPPQYFFLRTRHCFLHFLLI